MPHSMNPVAAAIYTKLTGATALTSLLTGGTASPSVYEILAPEGNDPPYVVFNAQSPSVPRYTLTGVAFENTVYQVKGVTVDHSAAAAGTIAQQIDAALNDQTLTVTGYTHLLCRRIADIDYPELVAGQRYQHRGGLYRVWVDPT